MGQRHNLAGAAHPGARHGRADALAQEVGQPLAELPGDARVAGQERAQPDRDDRPHISGIQPGRPAGRPGEHQVALVRELLGRREAYSRQRSHPGVHAVDRVAAAQFRARLLAAQLHVVKQPAADPHCPAGPRIRDRADQVRIQVGGGGDRENLHP